MQSHRFGSNGKTATDLLLILEPHSARARSHKFLSIITHFATKLFYMVEIIGLTTKMTIIRLKQIFM